MFLILFIKCNIFFRKSQRLFFFKIRARVRVFAGKTKEKSRKHAIVDNLKKNFKKS